MIKDKLAINVLLSTLSLGVSIGVGLYSYRYLWGGLSTKDFSTWFMMFEISQFLLLADMGFSHKFISKKIDPESKEFLDELNNLRLFLFTSGFVAAFIFGIVCFFYSQKIQYLIFSFILLGASLFVNILSYAETAALRVSTKNNEIYIISLFSQLLFMVIITGFSSKLAPLMIGCAVFFRSLTVFICQTLVLNKKYLPKYIKGNYFSISIVAINAAYFILFMLDIFIVGLTPINLGGVAILVSTRKYYDLVRTFWDSVLPNLYSRFLQKNDSKFYFATLFFCGLSFFCAVPIASVVLPIWLPNFKGDLKLNIALAISTFSISIFRLISIRMYYKKQLKWHFFLSFAVFIKIAFLLILMISIQDVYIAYFVQGILIIFFVLLINKN